MGKTLMNERIRRYVKRKYVANGEAPTVRDVSKAVGISQDDVQDEVDGDPQCEMLLSSHDWDGSIGGAYVELYEPPALGTGRSPTGGAR